MFIILLILLHVLGMVLTYGRIYGEGYRGSALSLSIIPIINWVVFVISALPPSYGPFLRFRDPKKLAAKRATKQLAKLPEFSFEDYKEREMYIWLQ